MKKQRIFYSKYLGLSLLLLIINHAPAQFIFDQTYPVLFPSDTSGLRVFPDFNIEQTDEIIQLTDCVSEMYTVLQMQQLTGELLDTLAVPTIPCGNLTLSNGTTLMVEPAPDGVFGYLFTNFLISGVVNWEQTYTNLPFFLNKDNVVSNPAGGYYLYNRSPFILQRYSEEGQLVYNQRPLELPDAYGTRIIEVAENGDIYLRSGHLGGNDTKIIISKLDGNSGEELWQTEIPTVRNLAQDTRIALAADYPLVVVNNNYGSIAGNGLISGGWDIAFLDATTGELVKQKEKIIIGNAAVSPVIIEDKGVYLLEEQHIDLETPQQGAELTNGEQTGFSLYHFSNEGEELWKKPLFEDIPFSSISVSQAAVANTDDLLLLGTKNDSLWLVKLDPDGDLYNAPELEELAPDLTVHVTADRGDLPLYDFLTFTVQLTNEGKVTAQDISVNAPFIDYQTLTATNEESVTHGQYYNWTGNWNIDSLAIGETAELTIKTFVLSEQPTTRFISIFEQTPADFDDSNNTFVLSLPLGNGQIPSVNIAPLTTTTFLNNTIQVLNDILQINLLSTNHLSDLFTIYDVEGKFIKQQRFDLSKGTQQLNWEVAELPRGAYILQQSGSGESWKFIR